MNCNRLAQSHSMLELPREDLSLNPSWGVVIVVVETDLAPPDVARMGHGFETELKVSTLRCNERGVFTYLSQHH